MAKKFYHSHIWHIEKEDKVVLVYLLGGHRMFSKLQ